MAREWRSDGVCVVAFSSLLRSLVSSHFHTHGLRRGLHSFAASRLDSESLATIPHDAILLLDRYRCLRSVYGDRLESGVARTAAGDGQRSLSAGLRLESQSNHASLTRDTGRATWARSRD